jgi:hypothetical protein
MPPILLALWFSNPLVLWGLGAAALPFLIHLLNRRKHREMPWAAMRFLLAAVKSNQRRVRLEQWLLLAVRTLLILLAVLAMARPFLESLGAVALLPGQRTHWVIALDGSLSMSTTPDGSDSSRFDHARDVASQIIQAARPGDGFSLVLLANPPRTIIGAPAFQRDAVLRELAQIPPTHADLDPAAAFRKIDEVLDASDVARKEIVILTDLQATSWSRPGLATDDSVKRLLARWTARHARSTLIDLGAPPQPNHAVVDLALDPPIVVPNAPAVVRASLRAFGAGSGADVTARLVIDGRLGPQESLRLEPGPEPQAVAFSHQFPTAGDHTVEIQVEPPDALKLDDRRRLVVPVLDAVKVLLVDGDPDPEPLKSETAFLAAALAPEPASDDQAAPAPVSPLSVEIAGESQLLARDLSRYDTVVLANLARLTKTEADALRAFVDQGGGLVVFPGDRLAPDTDNALLYDDGRGLLPAAYGPIVGDPARSEKPFEFDPLGFRHPIVSLYGGEGAGVQASLTSVKTSRYVRLVLPKGSPARVALAFSSGDPAIIERVRNRGRVIQLATTADPDWTTWPLHQSFPPIMEQIVLAAAAGRTSERNVRVGQPLTRAFPASAAGASGSVQTPAGGDPAPVTLTPDGDVSLLSFPGTDLAGLYTATLGPPIDHADQFAANPDPAESDPARLDAAALRAAIPGWDFVHEANWSPQGRDAGSVAHRGEVHRPLLWAVLALLLTDSLLAWKFGHSPRRRFQ